MVETEFLKTLAIDADLEENEVEGAELEVDEDEDEDGDEDGEENLD